MLRLGTEKARLQAEFNRQLPLFETKIDQLGNPAVSMAQDVQQLYVLHINDKFKNSHLSQLRTILSRGLFTVAFIAFSCGIWGWQTDCRRTALHDIRVHQGLLELNIQWRFVAPAEKDGLVIAKVTLTNYGTTKAQLPNWTFLDEHGLRIPAVQTSENGGPTNVPPRRSIHYTVLVKPAEPIPVQSLVAVLQ